ncbi:MAG: hypothetical protein ACRYF5_05070 [Janthinobacterium lividum]
MLALPCVVSGVGIDPTLSMLHVRRGIASPPTVPHLASHCLHVFWLRQQLDASGLAGLLRCPGNPLLTP